MKTVRSGSGLNRQFLQLLIVMLGLKAGSVQAQQAPVDLALVLAVDVSSSMTQAELALQRSGYVAALADPQVISALIGGSLHRIALSYVEWADPNMQAVTMDWRIIDSPQAALDFSADLAAQPLIGGATTSISAALRFSAAMFDTLKVAADRRIIDISGDGPNSSGSHVAPSRDQVVAGGIVINGIPILIDQSPLDMATGATLTDYYRDCVIGGLGAFVVTASEISGMAEAIRRKLVLEVAAVPVSVGLVRVAAQKPTDCTLGQKDFYE